MYKSIKFIISLIVLSLSLTLSVFAVETSDNILNVVFEPGHAISYGWIERHNNYYYYDANGEMVSNCWREIDNEWYYFDKNREMLQDKWISDDADLYYVGSDGIMYRSKWLYQNDKYYYFDKDGKLVKSNWVQDTYYVDEKGEMLKNTTKTIAGTLYVFDGNGVASEKSIEYRDDYLSNKYSTDINNSDGYWYTKNGNCYHEKYGCSGATLSYPPKNKSYRACSKCCRL